MNLDFWKEVRAKTIIVQSKYIDFLIKYGYRIIRLEGENHRLIRIKNNFIEFKSDQNLIDTTIKYLKFKGADSALETFMRGVSTYTQPKKLLLLPLIEIESDRDLPETSYFYFRNAYVEVTKGSIQIKQYETLKKNVWKSRIIDKEFNIYKKERASNFETFCRRISNDEDDRFNSLKSIIGYLLHRYQAPSITKAVILMDENLGLEGEANGGTGKGIIASAISKCREISTIDGKTWNSKSPFKNQMVELTTDILFYDDVQANFSLEDLYSMITSGVTVEKKFKHSFYIEPSNAPKILVSSNYPVKGTTGSTDRRRRTEFELSEHYSETFSPYDDFHEMLFDDWDETEWIEFYLFMMRCVKNYFNHGLIEYKSKNLFKNKIISESSSSFFHFIEDNVELNNWQDKRQLLAQFNALLDAREQLTSHMFTKFLKTYAGHKGYTCLNKSAGGKSLFQISKKKQ